MRRTLPAPNSSPRLKCRRPEHEACSGFFRPCFWLCCFAARFRSFIPRFLLCFRLLWFPFPRFRFFRPLPSRFSFLSFLASCFLFFSLPVISVSFCFPFSFLRFSGFRFFPLCRFSLLLARFFLPFVQLFPASAFLFFSRFRFFLFPCLPFRFCFFPLRRPFKRAFPYDPMKRLRKCKCGRYTLKDRCPKCGGEALSAHPPKYSPQDQYAEYRRKEKYG